MFEVKNSGTQAALKQLKRREMQVRKGGLPPLKLHNTQPLFA